MMRRFGRLALWVIVGLIVISAFSAVAATNTVQRTRKLDTSRPITVNDLKPPECAGLNLTQIVIGDRDTGGIHSLVLGSPGSETIRGGGGNDCIVGGGGNDIIRGQVGNDIVLGGPGDDSLDGGPGTDACYGQAGTDTFDASCETQAQ